MIESSYIALKMRILMSRVVIFLCLMLLSAADEVLSSDDPSATNTGAPSITNTGAQPAINTGAQPTSNTGAPSITNTGAPPAINTGAQPTSNTGAPPIINAVALPAIKPTPPDACLYYGEVFALESDIIRKEHRLINMCFGIYCKSDGSVEHWENFNCFDDSSVSDDGSDETPNAPSSV